jgi:HAD superfamily hydrolase (TIGR01459 family)
MKQRFLPNLANLLSIYDGFLIDIWGVIHNGETLYNTVLECLRKLQYYNKHVVFLTNSPKTSCDVEKFLERLGIYRSLYDSIYTAGDHFYDSYINYIEPKKQRKWFIVDDQNVSNAHQFLLDQKAIVTDNMYEADSILLASIDEVDYTLSSYDGLLNQCLKGNYEVFCMNPDIHVVTPEGFRMRPGALSKRFQERDINVNIFGKPEKSMFSKGLDLLLPVPHNRILMIGDSLSIDIKGAQAINLDSALVYQSYDAPIAMAHFADTYVYTPFLDKDLGDVIVELENPSIKATYYIPHLEI